MQFLDQINPEAIPLRRAVSIEVHSGEASFTPDKRFQLKENQGHWYAPYLASLITSGGRLLLALLEQSVKAAGGMANYPRPLISWCQIRVDCFLTRHAFQHGQFAQNLQSTGLSDAGGS